MEGPGGYKNELDGIPKFLLAYWGIYDHSFIHLFGQQKFSTCSILGTEGTAGTNKNKAPNSRSSHLVTGDTAGEGIKDFRVARKATKEIHRVMGQRVKGGRLSGLGS